MYSLPNMPRKKQYEYAEICITKLGNLVSEMKQIGLANGIREKEIEEVWQTIFQILDKKCRISSRLLSQNLWRKNKSNHLQRNDC